MYHSADSEMKSQEQHSLGQVGKGFSHGPEQQHKGRLELADKNGSDSGIRFGKGKTRQCKEISFFLHGCVYCECRLNKGPQHVFGKRPAAFPGGGLPNRFQSFYALLIDRPQPAFNDLFDEGRLGAEIIIDRRLVHPCLTGQLLNGGALEALDRKKTFRYVQNACFCIGP